jgi:phage recombination protein Bet
MTVTAIDTYQSAALAIRPGQEMWTDKQRAALTALGIKGASNADLAVFMHYCQKTGLDPFSKQIYLIGRRTKVVEYIDGRKVENWVDKQTIQVGIDGFRVIRDRVAERHGVTVEYEDTIWYDRDGGEHRVWLREDEPAGCVVTVIKDGHRYPGALRFNSYAARQRDTGELTGQWKTMPDHMIEKCAEAFALRRAFPHDLGGIYLEDEMPQQEPGAPAVIRQRGRVTVAEVIDPQDPPAVNGNGHAPDAASAANVPPAAPAESAAETLSAEPGSVLPQQAGQLASIYQNRFGFKRAEIDQIIKVSEQIAGRELTGPNDGRSHANLSAAEARKLIDTLESIGDRDELTAVLLSGDAGSGETA